MESIEATGAMSDVYNDREGSKRPEMPASWRVTYRSVRPLDLGAYGARLERSEVGGDAFVDVEFEEVAVHVRAGVAAAWTAP